MYQNNNLKKDKDNEIKPFYSMQSGNNKKINRYNNKYILIVGIVFLMGLLITFLLKDDKDMKDNIADNTNINVSEENNASEEERLKEVPEVESSKILTESETEMVKEAIANDSEGYLKLVNSDNMLDESYEPYDLVIPNVNLVADRSEEKNLVRADAAKALEEMFKAANEEGISLFLNSAYRGYDSQVYLYEEDTAAVGSDTSDYVAKPGASEHQLGLALDITSMNMDFELEEAFEDTPEGIWALNNAYKYGFVLRYIKGKEDITGYQYEPWHYRYIGNKEISKLCHDKNLTLEELYECINEGH